MPPVASKKKSFKKSINIAQFKHTQPEIKLCHAEKAGRESRLVYISALAEETFFSGNFSHAEPKETLCAVALLCAGETSSKKN